MTDIIIRTAKPDDAETLSGIYAYYVENTAVSYEYAAPSAEEFRGRIENTLKSYPYVVAECDGVILGYAYASPFHVRRAYDWSVEYSIYVRKDTRRGGVGAALYAELEKRLKAQGFLNVYACIACPDEEDEYLSFDSIRFNERMGYKVIGRYTKCASKFGRWYGMVYMEKHIGEHTQPEPTLNWPLGDRADRLKR